MFNWLIPLAAIVYSGYQIYINQTDPNAPAPISFWLQNLGIGGVGLWALLQQNINFEGLKEVLAAIFSKKKENVVVDKTVKTVETTTVVEDAALTPSELEEKDYACLVHLRNRFQLANSKEGLEVVKQLNDLIFSLSLETQPKTEKKKDA